MFSRVAHYGRAIQGMGALVHAQWCIRRYPFTRVADRLRQPLQAPHQEGDVLRVALDVRNALLAACEYLPWRATCLVRAIAAQSLLNRRRIPSVLVLSVAPNEAITLKAHAWLEAAGTVVVGRTEMQSYTPIYRFDNHPTSDPSNSNEKPARSVAPCSR